MKNQIHEIEMISIADLYPCSFNNRIVLDMKEQLELTSSIAEKGILNPLIVRDESSNDKKYQIIAGLRRYTAAVTLKLKTVPCQIKSMTDEEAKQIMVIDNLQRSNIHPLDEAAYFKTLLKEKSIHDIASAIFKPEAYVKKRLVLDDLIPAIKKNLYDGTISLGQAFVIARLNTDQQKEFYKDEIEEATVLGKTIKHLPDEKELLADITRKYMLTMKNAPFNVDDPDLVSKAGACSVCPKRSSNATDLFGDISSSDVCTDIICFNLKCSAALKLKHAALQKQLKGKVILAKASDYSDGSVVEIDNKKIKTVSLKEYPDAIPVLINKQDRNYSSAEGKVVGKLVYVRSDLKNPGPPKKTEKEKAEQQKQKEASIKDKMKAEKEYQNNLAFSKHLFEKAYLLLTDTNRIVIPSIEIKEILIETYSSNYVTGGQMLIPAVAVLEKFIIPIANKTYDHAYKYHLGLVRGAPAAKAGEEKRINQLVYDRLNKLPLLDFLMLSYLSHWSDYGIALNDQKNYLQVLLSLEIDFKVERERFKGSLQKNKGIMPKQGEMPKKPLKNAK